MASLAADRRNIIEDANILVENFDVFVFGNEREMERRGKRLASTSFRHADEGTDEPSRSPKIEESGECMGCMSTY